LALPRQLRRTVVVTLLAGPIVVPLLAIHRFASAGYIFCPNGPP
jgi:hypothetical protein